MNSHLVHAKARADHQSSNALGAQGTCFAEAHFDCGYMGSPTVAELAAEGAEILCKPWNARNGDLFTKDDFSLDLRSKTITCHAGRTEPIVFGKTTQFDPETCDACALRSQCTNARPGNGRTLSIHEDEPLQKRLRTMSKSKAGRQRFRQRIPVEHSLAHIGQRRAAAALATWERARTCTTCVALR